MTDYKYTPTPVPEGFDHELLRELYTASRELHHDNFHKAVAMENARAAKAEMLHLEEVIEGAEVNPNHLFNGA